MPLEKLNGFTKKVQDLADKPNATMSAAEIKAQFDAAPDEVRRYLNGLIDGLSSIVDGDSGADNIGVTPISTSPDKLQGMLEWLKTQLDNVVLGQIPEGTVVTPIEFNEHLTDETNPHNVTAEQLNAVKNTDTTNWQKHKLSGDNGFSKPIQNVDLNTVKTNGFYNGDSLVNAPLNKASWFFIEVQVHAFADAYIIQRATEMTNTNPTLYSRSCVGGVWQPWSVDLFTSVDNGKLALRTAILDNGGSVAGSHPNSFAELENGVKSLSGKISGTLPAGSTSRTVNTLTFSPSYVILWATNPSASSKNFDIRIMRSTAFPYQGAVSGAIPFGTVVTQASVSGANNGYQTGSTDGTFSANGFTANNLDINSNYGFFTGK